MSRLNLSFGQRIIRMYNDQLQQEIDKIKQRLKIKTMSNNVYDSLKHDWELDLEPGEDWDAEQSVKLTIGGVEVAEILGLDHGGCIDEDDEDYPKVKADLKFVSRLILKSKDMYELLSFCAEKLFMEGDTETFTRIKELQNKINNG